MKSDKRTISIVIPTYNRFDFTVESTAQVIDDDRVSEICISDDVSTDDSFEKLKDFYADNPKVKLYRNKTNQDCYRNKFISIRHAKNEWTILLDSDNIIDSSYLDKIFAIEEWDKKTSYMPSFAAPLFDYKEFSGLTITKENVASYMGRKLFDTMLNCFNFFVHRNEYLRVWWGNIDPVTADSLFFNYCWFKAGNKMYVVPGLKYQHRIHSQSHYVNNVKRTGNLYEEITEKINQLK